MSGKRSTNPFACCKNIEKYVVADNNATYKSVDGVIYGKTGQWLVAYPTAHTGNYTIRDGVTTVWPGAFEQSALTEVTCSNTVDTLCSYSFCDSKIKKITVSKSDRAMSVETFEGSKGLEKINVDKSNLFYESIDGIVYSKTDEYKSLLIYPTGKKSTSFKVPTNRKIGLNAFNSCVYLKKLYIIDMDDDMGYDFYDIFMKNCKAIKVYVASNFMSKDLGWRRDDNGTFAMGYNESSTKCKTYVKKNSWLAKRLDKKKIKYNVY